MAAIVVEDRSNGMEKASRANATAIRACMATIHQRLVLRMSTNGLQSGLMVHGRYNSPVYKAMVSFGTPRRVNIITEMLFTMKYGIPSAKYRVGIQNHGDPASVCFISLLLFLPRDSNAREYPCT